MLTSVKTKLQRANHSIDFFNTIGLDLSDLLSKPTVAIVGTRKPTAYGKEVTELFAIALARAGVVVVSGFAFGVDIAAHKACLSAGGNTIAVLASGVGNIYPASHQRYAADLLKVGCFVSMHEADHMPHKHEFLERNRIIAAFSDAVLITEAADKSGSLNTAKHAKELGVPVFAVPGPINSTNSKGTNILIQNGALPALDPSDILRALGLDQKQVQQSLLGSTPLEQAILEAVSSGACDESSIQLATQLSTPELQQSLTILEINGQLQRDSIGNWHIQ